MINVKSEEDARALAQEAIEKSLEQNESQIKEILDLASELKADDADFDFITSMLELPEDQFKLLAPAYLGEYEKSLRNPNTQRLILQALNTSGQTAAQITEDFIKTAKDIENIYNNSNATISAQKIDFIKQMLEITANAYMEVEGTANKTILIPISYCREDAKMPAYAHMTDAGMDVFATEDITIKPGETVLVPVGIKVAIPIGYELQVRPKSGRALKTKLRVANTPGTIDSGYRDEVCVIIENIEPAIKDIEYEFDDNGNIIIKSILHGSDFTIGKGEKFAQLVLAQVQRASFMEVDDVAKIENDGRNGGFGSSGLK